MAARARPPAAFARRRGRRGWVGGGERWTSAGWRRIGWSEASGRGAPGACVRACVRCLLADGARSVALGLVGIIADRYHLSRTRLRL
jgi:hypothetical protein